MPMFLNPGVYVEEYDAQPKPIPGVPAAVDDATATALVDALARVPINVSPPWTQFNRSDPGIALVELLGWVAEGLMFDAATEARRDTIRRVATSLAARADGCETPCGPIARPRFFAGRFLDAAALTAEQDYHRDRLRRHNRELHGFGVVRGLGVRIDGGSAGARLVVDAGYALDPGGDEIVVAQPAMLGLPAAGDDRFVSARRFEHPCGPPVPVPDGSEPTRIGESCMIAVRADVPSNAVALARLVCAGGVWSIDSTFAPPRIRR